MHGRLNLIALILSVLSGCGSPALPSEEPQEQGIMLGDRFDGDAAGMISGRVTWAGDAPVAKESLVRAIACNPRLHVSPAQFNVLHLPKIDPRNQGVADAVVFLRGVDPRRGKPWDHLDARVEFHERRLIVRQGQRRSAVGFVLRGGTIDIVNRDPEYHNLHGRGDAFFSLPLMRRGRVHTRALTKPGLVSLSCGAGNYWMDAHLFVVKHPYYARTDSRGRFRLDGVPPGDYEAVCWLPNWQGTQAQRDPESGHVVRFLRAPPIERTQTVRAASGRTTDVDFVLTAAD